MVCDFSISQPLAICSARNFMTGASEEIMQIKQINPTLICAVFAEVLFQVALYTIQLKINALAFLASSGIIDEGSGNLFCKSVLTDAFLHHSIVQLCCGDDSCLWFTDYEFLVRSELVRALLQARIKFSDMFTDVILEENHAVLPANAITALISSVQ